MCVPLLQKSLFCETEYNKRKEQVFFSLRNFNRHILDCMFVIFVCVRVFCCKATGRRLYKKKSWEGKVNFCISFFFFAVITWWWHHSTFVRNDPFLRPALTTWMWPVGRLSSSSWSCPPPQQQAVRLLVPTSASPRGSAFPVEL